MIAKLHHPAYPLNRFIESFFYYTGFSPEHAVDRFLPDGNVQLIIDLTDEPKYIYNNDTLRAEQSCRKVWFSGFRTEPITIPSGRECEMLVINFYKGKAYPFLREPLHALTNCVVDAEQVWKSDILGLRTVLQEGERIEQKFLLLEKALLLNFQNELYDNPFVDYAVSLILAAPNQFSVRELTRKVGYSSKHLIKIFKDHVGVTPKEFLRVIRFQKTIEDIEQHKEINWTTIAFDSGYYDQSHFIADFKFFSGFTPVQYLNKRGEYLNYLPVLPGR